MHGCLTDRSAARRLIPFVAGSAIGLSRATTALCASTLLLTGPLAQTHAQQPVAAPTLEGRDFGNVRFPADAQAADITLSSLRATVWTDRDPTGGDPIGAERVLLQGDVRVEIRPRRPDDYANAVTSGYSFTASQAVVWIKRLTETPARIVAADAEAQSALGPEALGMHARPPASRYQVAIFFDRVADPGAEAGFAQAADRLLITAVIDGRVSLRSDSVVSRRPEPPIPGGQLVLEGERRLAQHLRAILGIADPSDDPSRDPIDSGPAQRGIRPGVSRPFEPNSPYAPTRTQPTPAPTPPEREQAPEPIFSREGVFTIAVGTQRATPSDPAVPAGTADSPEIRLVRGGEGEDNALLLTGGVSLTYQDIRQIRNLQITAQRAVIFLEPGPLTDLGRFNARSVKGVYVEGDVVATDGQYTVRGPRVYYDVQNNQALMVDAVFFTFDQRLQMPIYVRAKELRQQSADQFSAGSARLATTSFFDPVLSVGASSITITQKADTQSPGQTRSFIDAQDLTLRGMNLPFFWLPRYRGFADNIPLKDFRVENSSGSGAAVKTGWDIFGLLGVEDPRDIDSRLLLDLYFDRGIAVGNRTDWNTDRHEGEVFGYIVPSDDGEDVLSSGARRGRSDETRGMILARDRWTLGAGWTLFTEASYFSDENFVDAFFRPLGFQEREYSTGAYLRHIEGNAAFTAQIKTNLNDFTPNQYLLTSQGYTVEKLPEAAYYRVADDLLGGANAGLLMWTHEYRVGRMALNFVEPTADELGFNRSSRSQAALGIDPNQSPADVLRAAGLNQDDVLRFDTRQELSSTVDFYWLKVTPFAVGRFTAYDTDFDTFTSDFDDQYRYYYSLGTRFSTQIQRVDDSVDSDFFDLHRIRHIIEPSMTVWYAGASASQNDLPVYDTNVESLTTGSAVRAGVRQVWQTKRGGPGRWRNVDWITLDTNLVFSTDDADRESPIKRFFDYRPEYSQLGDFANVEAIWQFTDSIALSASHIYDLDIHQPALTTAGGLVQHTPDFSSFAEVRYINALDVTYVDAGCAYELTRRYSLAVAGVYDTDRNEVQSIGGTVRRKMGEGVMGVGVRYNNITSETSVSVVFEPQIANNQLRQFRLRELGR
ncbi:MAG: LPS assembly protein LptD [Phycisphaeraceae bacterium]|nr:LPS assembly protein LptD [Phycisphaeraceae bacterium]